MFVSYAQNFEDVILWRPLRGIKGGHYVDIGAQDPFVDSVSRSFYENGWRGVHADANPEYAQKLRDARPDEQVVEAIIGIDGTSEKFFVIPGTGLSTGDPGLAERYRNVGYDVQEHIAAVVPLSKLLASILAPDVHWMKIDVEGMEAAVLSSWGACEVRPWILCIESTDPNSQTPNHERWEHEVLCRGYQFVYFDGLSRFYVHENQKHLTVKFGPGPNLFDNFVLCPSSGFVDQINLASLRSEIAALSSKLSAANEIIVALQNSLSWKLTAPLRIALYKLRRLSRSLSIWVGLSRDSHSRRALQLLLTHAMLWVKNRPRLARLLLRLLQFSPALEKRLINAAHARGLALSLHPSGVQTWHLDVEPEVIEKWKKRRK